jgi:hypothetical protein
MLGMSSSPIDPEDIRAAAEVHRELGPEYGDAVVASFLDKVDREIAARVEARLADTRVARPAKRDSRRALLRGMAIGVCAGALAAGVAVSGAGGTAPASAHPNHVHVQVGAVPVPKPPTMPKPPKAPTG